MCKIMLVWSVVRKKTIPQEYPVSRGGVDVCLDYGIIPFLPFTGTDKTTHNGASQESDVVTFR